MATGDLVQLAAAKAWLGVTPTTTMRCSQRSSRKSAVRSTTASIVLLYCRRNVVESSDGLGGDRLLLRNWPVGAITSVSVDGLEIPPAGPTPSLRLHAGSERRRTARRDAAIVSVGAYRFCRGRQNIVVAIARAMRLSGEAQSVPAAAPFTSPPRALWRLRDRYGRRLCERRGADASRRPSFAGQYAVDPTSGHIRSRRRTQAQHLAVLGYVPADLSQAALEWVAERYRYKTASAWPASLGGPGNRVLSASTRCPISSRCR